MADQYGRPLSTRPAGSCRLAESYVDSEPEFGRGVVALDGGGEVLFEDAGWVGVVVDDGVVVAAGCGPVGAVGSAADGEAGEVFGHVVAAADRAQVPDGAVLAADP